MFNSDLSLREVLGFTDTAAREAWLAIRGQPGLPGSRFGLSSLRIFAPRLAAATWRGKKLLGRRVPILNLFNRTPTPVELGWSVRVTQVRDFRGGALTYDSHNGTDFALPPGTSIVAAAPGRVVARRSEYNRGGLKLYVDHGGGLMTSYNHLARALVQVGDVVARGQLLALSGYSGLDALASFLAVPPHLHFNVYLGGVQVDPFAASGETSLWLGGDNVPVPATDANRHDAAAPTTFARDAVARLESLLPDGERRGHLQAIANLDERAWALVIEANTYPTRFARAEAARLLFAAGAAPDARAPRLTLPLRGEDFERVAFADDEGLR
jgi:murein DD-endopeptidase MepM/ murein hydrolase activator NlpD